MKWLAENQIKLKSDILGGGKLEKIYFKLLALNVVAFALQELVAYKSDLTRKI